MATFPSDDHAAVSVVAVVEELLANAIEGGDGNTPPWRGDDEYASAVIVDVISSLSARSGPGKDGQTSSHLQSIIHTDVGQDEFGRGMTAFWRTIVCEADAFPPGFWKLFTQSRLTALGEKHRQVCMGTTWRRFIAAGTMP